MGKVKEMLTEEEQRVFNLMEIAMVKAWNFSMEYDPTSGREVEKAGHQFLKEGYIEGFLAGFAHKFEQND